MKGKHRAKRDVGGRAPDDRDVTTSYTGDSNVTKEARGEARKRGGMCASGGASKHRLDRPGRKRGGGVGADTSPLSTASRTKDEAGGKEDD